MGFFFGYSFGGSGGKKKKPTKSYASWFERLPAEQVRALVVAAKLPVSGSKKKQIERLVLCPSTLKYGMEGSGSLSVADLKQECRTAQIAVSGTKYSLVLRLLEHIHQGKCSPTNKRAASCSENDKTEDDNGPLKKKAKVTLRKPLEGEELQKRITFRRQKLNKQIDNRLAWKSSFRYMSNVKGSRVEIECSEPEVFTAIFDDGNDSIKTTGAKLIRTFKEDDEIEEMGLHGKTYRFGAHAYLKAPATATLNDGKLTFTFKYTVSC